MSNCRGLRDLGATAPHAIPAQFKRNKMVREQSQLQMLQSRVITIDLNITIVFA